MPTASRLVSLDQLRYFVALADERHFTRAAEACNVAQPPFSRSIARLESALNVTLILRNNRFVDLTDGGRVFAERSRQILAMLDDAIEHVHSVQSATRRLRLGMLEYAFTVFGLQFVEEFACTHSSVQLEPVDMPPEHLAFTVTHGGVDLQFAALSERDRIPARLGLRELVVVSEPLGGLMDCNHPLVKSGAVTVADLARNKLVLFERSRAPDVHRAVMQSFADRGVRGAVELEVGFFQTMIAAVRATNRIGLVPLSAGSLVSPGLTVVPLLAAEMPKIRLSLVWSESRETPELLEFVRWITERLPIVRQRSLYSDDKV